MSFDRTLRHLTEQTPLIKSQHSESFAAQAHAFVRLGGAFPVSRNLVSCVRSRLAGQNLTAPSLSQHLSIFPVLSARLLALCNQTYYMRGQEVTTLDAGMNQLGLLRMADILEELGASNTFSSTFHGRAIASARYQETIMTNMLAMRFYKILSPVKQTEHLSSLLCGLSSLSLFALSYLRPEIYSSLILDNFAKEHGRFDRTFKRVFRSAAARFSGNLMDEMSIPRILSDRVSLLEIAPWNRRTWAGAAEAEIRFAVISAYLAQRAVREIYRFRGSHYLTKLLKDFENRTRTHHKKFQECLSGLSDQFLDAVEDVGLVPLRIPEYLRVYDDLILDDGKQAVSRKSYTLADRLNSSLIELKACINTEIDEEGVSRLPQAVHSTTLALLRAFQFDRVVLFAHDREEGILRPVFWSGREPLEIEDFKRELESFPENQPDSVAFFHRKTVFHGDPLFGDDWPFVAFPIIWDHEVEAVFYADRKQTKDAHPLSTEEQVSLIALGEIWQHTPTDFR